MIEFLPSFRSWLISRNYSDSTVRNYLVDVRKFLSSGSEPSDYLHSLTSDPNFKRTYSSLKLFFQFAVDQQLVTTNPVSKKLLSPPTPSNTDLVSLFKTHLEKRNTPISTIRNYINDLNQYINWLKNT